MHVTYLKKDISSHFAFSLVFLETTCCCMWDLVVLTIVSEVQICLNKKSDCCHEQNASRFIIVFAIIDTVCTRYKNTNAAL